MGASFREGWSDSKQALLGGYSDTLGLFFPQLELKERQTPERPEEESG